MEKIIYLEPDDEITTVIDKIRKATRDKVTLVVPKAATILQSIVNLKLLKKEAHKLGKKISIVTSDDTGRNLASQVGLTVYRDVAKRPEPEPKKPIEAPPKEPEKIPTEETKIQKEPDFTISKKEPEAPKKEEPKMPEEKPEPKKPQAFDIRPSGVSFKPYKDEKRAGLAKKDLGKESPIKSAQRAPSKLKKILVIIGIILGVLIVGGVVASYFLLPKAEVRVSLLATKAESTVELVAQKESSLDEKTMTLSAQEYSNEQGGSKIAKTTGTKEIGEKARGTISAINETGVDQPLVATTRFRAANGLIFRTSTGITVPKATLDKDGNKVNGSVNVTVTAQEPGDSYNIGATSFTIPGLSASQQQKIYGRSSTAMSGGSSRTVQTVSQEDVDKAKAELTEELKTKAREALNSEINQDEDLVFDGAIASQIIEESANPALGAEGTEFTLSLKVKFTLLSVKKEEYFGLIKKAIEKEISKDKEVIEEELEKNTVEEISELKISEGSMIIKATTNAPVVAKMDEEVMKGSLGGKKSEDAVSYLKSFEEIHDASVSLWPFFVRKIPSSLNKINLITSYYIDESKGKAESETQE